jgi:outer membrane protein assembly factor BamB
MRTTLGILLVIWSLAAMPADEGVRGAETPLGAADLEGTWAGTASYGGETEPLALELERGQDGQLAMRVSVPLIHMVRQSFGSAPLKVRGNDVEVGPFRFAYDPEGPTLTGTMPDGFVPAHEVLVRLSRVERFEVPERPAPTGVLVEPRWTFDVGSPVWAGPTFADGTVYAGGDDGRLVALDARRGGERWSFRAGGPIRTRPTVSAGDVYFQAGDGVLYKLSAATGEVRWRVRVAEHPPARLPVGDPQSRYDPFDSEVVIAGSRLYLGTYDGRVLALDGTRGERIWELATGDSVVAAPALDGGRLYVGSFDRHVYALDAATGRPLWKRDLRGAVVSTPALAGSRVVVGTRSYDLFALDAASGEPVWRRYIWFSWIESSAVIRDGLIYIGSSDANAVFAMDERNGGRLWKSDVRGWAWGTPAVTPSRVYVGTSTQVGYNASAEPGAYALDRSSGRIVWRHPLAPSASGAYGFPGSPAAGADLVFFGGLDGRVYAFQQ